jgi:hypothetical protein
VSQESSAIALSSLSISICAGSCEFFCEVLSCPGYFPLILVGCLTRQEVGFVEGGCEGSEV